MKFIITCRTYTLVIREYREWGGGARPLSPHPSHTCTKNTHYASMIRTSQVNDCVDSLLYYTLVDLLRVCGVHVYPVACGGCEWCVCNVESMYSHWPVMCASGVCVGGVLWGTCTATGL
jgi:hypothetical protein